VGWFGTGHPGGGPHLVPVWFYWDGVTITVYSKRDARKVRNLEAVPEVAFAVEPRAGRMCSVLIEGHAEVLPTSERLEPGFRRKYGRAIRRVGLEPSSFARTYPQAIRIVPVRIQKYGNLGAPPAATEMQAAD
jgi:PPOX class probable F420-dependent enzyme